MPPHPAPSLDRNEAASHLARQPILRGLNEAGLAQLLAYTTLRTLRARARLFAVGDPGQALYVVVSGWIKLSRPGANGRDVVLELAGPGSLFGELAVLCSLRRATDATALSAARLLAVDGRALIAALRANPDALLAVIRMLAQRLARTTAQVEDGQVPAEPRLARALLRLAELDPLASRAGMVIDLGLSQTDLAELTGLTRESINRMLGTWRDRGLIRVKGRSVTLVDSAGLRDLAEHVSE